MCLPVSDLDFLLVESKTLEDPIQQRLYDAVVEMRGVYRSILYSCFAAYTTVLKAIEDF